jgi:hypothetical protein
MNYDIEKINGGKDFRVVYPKRMTMIDRKMRQGIRPWDSGCNLITGYPHSKWDETKHAKQ